MNVFQSVGEHLPWHAERTTMANRRVGAAASLGGLFLVVLGITNPDAFYSARTVCTPAEASTDSWSQAELAKRALGEQGARFDSVHDISQPLRQAAESGMTNVQVCATDRGGMVGALVEVVTQHVSVEPVTATNN